MKPLPELGALWEWTPAQALRPPARSAPPKSPTGWCVYVEWLGFSQMPLRYLKVLRFLCKEHFVLLRIPTPKGWKVYRMLDSFIWIFVKISPLKLHINLPFIKALLRCVGLHGEAGVRVPSYPEQVCAEMLVNELEPCLCGMLPGPAVDVYKLIV